jgi:putative CocE/NonD family hydrolase
MLQRTLLLVLCACSLVFGQGVDWVKANYVKQESMVPMRDGVKLFTAIYAPKDTSKPYPFMMVRSPYSSGPYGAENYKGNLAATDKYPYSGYIFVFQDVRGRFQSEGAWTEMTPHIAVKRGPNDVDESSDTYDTIEWLLKNVPGNNGRAGLTGVSYPGFYAAAGMIDAHPALKAVSPQAPVVDLFRGDDSFHNGAFYLAANFGFYTFYTPHTGPAKPGGRFERFQYGTNDGYEFYLGLGPLSNADEKYFKFKNPYWTALTRHTSYDEFWKARNLAPHVKNITPAVLITGGWYDAEDLQGPLRLYRAATANSPKGPVTLVMGPWGHGGWARGDGDHMGQVKFGMKSGPEYREKIEFPFFESHLKGDGTWDAPAASMVETGTWQWRTFDAWPPAGTVQKMIYFDAGGTLAFDKPAAAGADQYISDPSKPVPFTSFITMGMAREYMVDDQRHASKRPDVLVYQTTPLEQDLTLAGPVSPKLWVSTTGTDSDFVVKLIDVYPAGYPDPDNTRMGGYQQLVRGEPFRARFRKSMEKPEAMPAGEFVELAFDMPDILHTFKKGHRLMVQIQSSWFPLVDRNPQKFVPNIPEARPEDFIVATQRVARGAARPSGIRVSVLAADPAKPAQ